MEPFVRETEPIRILLVEDEFLIAEWVAESLSEQGFAVKTVTNAGDALRYLASAPVDVLFTDINLPGGMDGAALARRARELLPDLARCLCLRAGDDARTGSARARRDLRAKALCTGNSSGGCSLPP